MWFGIWGILRRKGITVLSSIIWQEIWNRQTGYGKTPVQVAERDQILDINVDGYWDFSDTRHNKYILQNERPSNLSLKQFFYKC